MRDLQLVVDKLNVEKVNTLSFKVSIDALMVHWPKKQEELMYSVQIHKMTYHSLFPSTHAVHHMSIVHCLFTHAVPQLSTVHCVFSMLSIGCLQCTVSVHPCCPSAVYHALFLFTHAVHQLSTVYCVCLLMLSISCLLCNVSVHCCCPSAAYCALCLITHAVHQLSTVHCICSLMLSIICLSALCLFIHAVHQLSNVHCVH